MNKRRIVITGLGALTPIGNNVDEFFSGLAKGKNGVGLITNFDTTNFKTKFACELKNFDSLNHFDKKTLRKTDNYCIHALVSAREAIKDSGLELDKIDKERCGVIWGSGIGGINSYETEVIEYSRNEGRHKLSPFFITKMISNMAPGLIAMEFGFYGVNYTTVSACASSNHALLDAYNYIQMGDANLIIAGGSEYPITETSIGGFSSMKAISTNENYHEASRPYDVDRDGFVAGEGAGAIVLEEYEHAKNRGAKIYAEFVGGGMSSDAYHISAPHPEGRGAALSMKNALKRAGISSKEIQYINAHGTSTPAGDIPELLAVKSVFEENLDNLFISSTKSMTGHLLGAAGAIEALATIYAVKNDFIPPTINTKNLDPDIPKGINIVTGSGKKQMVEYALSNTFGFGGHNASVVFKKFTD